MNNRITVLNTDIFDSPRQTIVNPVNTVGIMGKGLAFKFKRLDYTMFADYQRRCNLGELKTGEPYIFKSKLPSRGKYKRDKWVVVFPTKRHWKDDSKLDYIVRGLDYMSSRYKEWGVESIAFPALGCGLGNLSHRDVIPVIFYGCRHWDIPVDIHCLEINYEDMERCNNWANGEIVKGCDIVKHAMESKEKP